jgi:hypothetical protein
MEWKTQSIPHFSNLGSTTFEVKIDGHIRKTKRVGHDSMSLNPGLLIFIDCTHPLQNVICPEQMITAWRET